MRNFVVVVLLLVAIGCGDGPSSPTAPAPAPTPQASLVQTGTPSLDCGIFGCTLDASIQNIGAGCASGTAVVARLTDSETNEQVGSDIQTGTSGGGCRSRLRVARRTRPKRSRSRAVCPAVALAAMPLLGHSYAVHWRTSRDERDGWPSQRRLTVVPALPKRNLVLNSSVLELADSTVHSPSLFSEAYRSCHWYVPHCRLGISESPSSTLL